MKNLLRNLFLPLVLFAATTVYAVPTVNVTVSTSGGEVAFRGTTDANGTFVTPSLKPGHYFVQFNSKSAAVKSNTYVLVISAGSKKVVANAVSGEMFGGPGVAMKMDLGARLNIAGQVADATSKILVWMPPMPGSNMPGSWVDKGSAEEMVSRTRLIIPRSSIQKIQDHGDVGH